MPLGFLVPALPLRQDGEQKAAYIRTAFQISSKRLFSRKARFQGQHRAAGSASRHTFQILLPRIACSENTLQPPCRSWPSLSPCLYDEAFLSAQMAVVSCRWLQKTPSQGQFSFQACLAWPHLNHVRQGTLRPLAPILQYPCLPPVLLCL